MAALTEHYTLPVPAFDAPVRLLIVVAPYYRAIADGLIAGARGRDDLLSLLEAEYGAQAGMARYFASVDRAGLHPA